MKGVCFMNVATLRSEIFVIKVFRFSCTMAQMEDYFNVNSRYLAEELKEFFRGNTETFEKVLAKLVLNERNRTFVEQRSTPSDLFER